METTELQSSLPPPLHSQSPFDPDVWGDDYLPFSRIKFSLVISRFQFWTPKRRGGVIREGGVLKRGGRGRDTVFRKSDNGYTVIVRSEIANGECIHVESDRSERG